MKEYEFVLYYDFWDYETQKWFPVRLVKSEEEAREKTGLKGSITVLQAWKAFEETAENEFLFRGGKDEKLSGRKYQASTVDIP